MPYYPYGYYDGEVPTCEALYWKVRGEFQNYVDLEPIWIDVLTTCILLSYQQEKMLTVPYVFLYGDNESGKSTVLQLMGLLCYRPMYAVTIPVADMYGYLESSDSISCILEDEIQGIHKDIDKIKIFKSGYKKGAVVPRMIITPYDRVIKFYNTFCFKVCASERIPFVKGFRERFIEIPMVEGYPNKEWCDNNDKDLERFYQLRNILLKWRMLTRNQPLSNIQLKIRGRLKELWKPILQTVNGLTVYNTLAKFVEDQKNERLSSKQNTLEGHIVKTVTEICNEIKVNPVPPIRFHAIWSRLANDLEGKIDENKPHVMDTSEFWRVTKSKVGYRLREILSGKSKTIREKIPGKKDADCPRVKAYEFNMKKLTRVAKKYGYELVTKLPTEPSSQSIDEMFSTSENVDSNIENNVEKETVMLQQVGSVGNSVTNCWICHQLLPKDLKNCTVEEGKNCHISCWKDLKAGFIIKDDLNG